jgi:hypothetical protein
MKYTYDDYYFYSGIIYGESPVGVHEVPPDSVGRLHPKWNGSAWELAVDYRGTNWFNSNTKKYDVSVQPDDERSSPWVEVIGGEITSSFPPADGAYVFDYVAKEWIPDNDTQEAKVREKRNQLLLASDWTQLADIPAETKALWEPYRQALRDVTDQPGYPYNIVWPTPPSYTETVYEVGSM